LKAILNEYDGLAIRSATKVTAELLDAAPNLKVIGRAGIGSTMSRFPPPPRGVSGDEHALRRSITTAEHAVALMFALARELPAADVSTQAGKWEKNRFMGVS
jgi:D-3-phosphoglycerate dehydrogenase